MVRSPCRRLPVAEWCRRSSWLRRATNAPSRGTTKAPSRGRREAQSGLDSDWVKATLRAQKQLRVRGQRCGISGEGNLNRIRKGAKTTLRAGATPHDILYRLLGTRQNSPRPLRGAACGTKYGKA